jgi:hypothetical protein
MGGGEARRMSKRPMRTEADRSLVALQQEYVTTNIK